MKTRALSLKLAPGAPAGPLSLATCEGPVFAMLDAPGVVDAHGDTMDAGALRLPPGVNEIPLYWCHSYHPEVAPDVAPQQRLPVGTATVWEEGGQWYFTPTFNRLTAQSELAEQQVAAWLITDCSVGYLTVDATPNGQGPDGTGEDVHAAKLLEVSLVDIGAKEGAMRVKAMADDKKKDGKQEEKKPEGEEPSMDEQWKAMRADVEATKSAVAKMAEHISAMHAKAFPPEEKKPDEEGANKDEKKKDEEPPPEDAVTKWWGSKGFRLPTR